MHALPARAAPHGRGLTSALRQSLQTDAAKRDTAGVRLDAEISRGEVSGTGQASCRVRVREHRRLIAVERDRVLVANHAYLERVPRERRQRRGRSVDLLAGIATDRNPVDRARPVEVE